MRFGLVTMSPANQTAEQIARDKIDNLLRQSGWCIQDKSKINLNEGIGVAVREYQTDVGPADYVLFVDRKPAGILEAKRKEEGQHLVSDVEGQSEEYAKSKLKYLNNDPLPFVYESTGEITRFTDYRDPKPRSREVFSFHRPETFREWLKKEKSLRGRLNDLPALPSLGLRDCQIKAINNLEDSFKHFHPRALVQMATGSGKTYTAITSIYRLLKFSDAKRILFLVNTKNLGEQAEQELMNYTPQDDNRKFTELYGVYRLHSSHIPTNNQVYISTIQRMYSILKGEELDEKLEEENPNETKWQAKKPVPVTYNEKIPIEFFDFIIIDECHQSIYNLWKQVLDYFDAFLIGLTATPDNRTFGFFNKNVVSEYSHEQAVTDGVNVGYDVFEIETQVSRHGGRIEKGEYIDRREKLSRKKRWEQLDEDAAYSAKQLDDEVVNPNQIRTIIRAFKDYLPQIFQREHRYDEQGNFEVPKTLIFAKTDSHADDIIQIVREEFGEGNAFCKKITYREEDPKSVLAQFRNSYNPRIAVTVDMIATGTDVKPLEVLLFMRDVKSRNYFEQMKGRGTRTISLDDLKKVTPTAKLTKDHFVIVDAIGVTKSLKTDSRPLERKPGVPLKDLLSAVAVGARDEDLFTSLANRLARLEKQMTEKEQQQFTEKTQGKKISQVVKELLGAYNPDVIDHHAGEMVRQAQHDGDEVTLNLSKNDLEAKAQEQLIERASSTFTGELNQWIDNVRKVHEQIIDTVNPDTLLTAGFSKENWEKAATTVADFKQWMADHRDEITALQIFYSQPVRRREITYAMIKDVLEKLKSDKPALAPLHVWRAYELLNESQNGSPKNELIALVSLIRNVCGMDDALTPYDKTVDRNFRDWILKKNAGQHNRFSEEQLQWLRMIKDYIASSFHIEKDDFDLSPFNAHGGLGKMWQLFGEETEKIIEEMNEELAA